MVTATRVKQRREAAGMTRRDLAEALGATERTIRLIERGARTPSLIILARMARTLRCRLGELIDEEERHDGEEIENPV